MEAIETLGPVRKDAIDWIIREADTENDTYFLAVGNANRARGGGQFEFPVVTQCRHCHAPIMPGAPRLSQQTFALRKAAIFMGSGGKRVGRPSVLTPEKLELARLLAENKGRAVVARIATSILTKKCYVWDGPSGS